MDEKLESTVTDKFEKNLKVMFLKLESDVLDSGTHIANPTGCL